MKIILLLSLYLINKIKISDNIYNQFPVRVPANCAQPMKELGEGSTWATLANRNASFTRAQLDSGSRRFIFMSCSRHREKSSEIK